MGRAPKEIRPVALDLGRARVELRDVGRDDQFEVELVLPGHGGLSELHDVLAASPQQGRLPGVLLPFSPLDGDRALRVRLTWDAVLAQNHEEVVEEEIAEAVRAWKAAAERAVPTANARIASNRRGPAGTV